jgi:FkbM family methyltransferase
MKNIMITDVTEKNFIIDFFKNKPNGRFLEIGANDGEPTQDTEPMWGLVEKGWSGVYCEPNPISCAKLISNILPYKDKIQVFNGAVSMNNNEGLVDFYLSLQTRMSSSLDPTWSKKQYYYKPEHQQYPMITSMVSFQSLIDFVGNDFDCISIDVENNSAVVSDLLMSIDWGQFKNCKVLCLEAATSKVIEYLKTFNYTEFIKTPVHNLLCIKPT